MKKKLAIILSALTIFYVTADYSADRSVSASSYIDNREYVLGGNIVGLKLYSKGLILLDFQEIS